MSVDPSLLESEDLFHVVRAAIAEVLMVPVEKVLPQAALVADLGAESIDFMDLVFRLDEALGQHIPIGHWNQFVADNLGDRDLTTAITTQVVVDFAAHETASL